jgi:hypothetical protein
MLTQAELDGYLGKHISLICDVGFKADSDNHCAHFVCHVLGYHFGLTCRAMVSGKGGTPASIRVQEVFPECGQVGNWSDLPGHVTEGLVFITNAHNVHLDHQVMDNVPRKHVGIFIAGAQKIWHYSNSQRRVVKQSPDEFSRHYPVPDNAMFWGSMP